MWRAGGSPYLTMAIERYSDHQFASVTSPSKEKCQAYGLPLASRLHSRSSPRLWKVVLGLLYWYAV